MWTPPFPVTEVEYNELHREGWEKCKSLIPSSNDQQRSDFAHGYARGVIGMRTKPPLSQDSSER